MRPALLSGGTLVECLTRHIEAAPRAVATFPASDERLTAMELEEESRGFALALLEQGVGPGCLVGLLMSTTSYPAVDHAGIGAITLYG